MIVLKDGNILNSQADFIVHQVNCLGIMGGGLALQIREWRPKHYDDYLEKCKPYLDTNDEEELLGDSVYTKYEHGFIYGIFGQLNCGMGCMTRYDAVEKALTDLVDTVMHTWICDRPCRIAIPYMMSCGLAGGDWDMIMHIINKVFNADPMIIEKIDLEIWKFNGDPIFEENK